MGMFLDDRILCVIQDMICGKCSVSYSGIALSTAQVIKM
jgi:hypothetical protein